MKKTHRIIFLFLIILISTGCSDETIPSLKGDMIGFVFTFDEFGNLYDDHQGVIVTGSGVHKMYTTTTEETGRFQLRGLPTGTYEIHFEKEGYGTLKQFSVQHLGGKPTLLGINDGGIFFIYEMPTTGITNLVFNKDTAYGEFQFMKGPVPQYLNLRLFFSDSPDFSENSLKFNADFKIGVNGPNWHSWKPSGLPFNPGSTVYYKAAINTKVDYIYIRAQNHNLYQFNGFERLVGISTYYDVINKKTVNPNIGNESEVYSFVFPD